MLMVVKHLKKAKFFHLNELIQGAYLQTGSSLIPQDRFGAYYLIIILGDLCNELHWPMHACKEDIFKDRTTLLLLRYTNILTIIIEPGAA